MQKSTLIAIVSGGLFALTSCNKTVPTLPLDNELLDGPIAGLNAEEQARFLAGDEAFGDVFTTSEGLGPIFVATACAECHPGDGKGSNFVKFTRFGQADTINGNTFLDQGGPQLQHKAIPGYVPETLPSAATKTELVAPAVTGLGYLDAVPDADLIALADPFDTDGDGISGRPHYNTIPGYVSLRPMSIGAGGRYITRFGKKGSAYDLLHQTLGAYNQDMGVTSLFEPIDVYSGEEVDPEVGTQTVNDVVFYLKTLRAPARRDSLDPDVLAGEALFSSVECAKCHTPTLTTGWSDIPVLSNAEFHPYTDLLLHDMGPGLDDGYTEGYATTAEWRTPPLWGLGLSKDFQGGTYALLHDGRATTLIDAITMHGGEAQNSVDLFNALSTSEQGQLIKFLESL